MKNISKLFVLTALLLVGACKKQDANQQTDNLFKFKEYIGYHTMGRQSIGTPITIGLNQVLTDFEISQELSKDILSISPKTEGVLTVENGQKIIFVPTELLQPNTTYSVSLKLNKLLPKVLTAFKTYRFEFQTLEPNFKINLDQLQSYTKDLQYISGTLEANDLLPFQDLNSLLSVTQNGKPLSVKWNEANRPSLFYSFTIDSITRKEKDSKIEVSWNGKAVGVANNGTTEYTIPGRNKLVITDVKTSASPNAILTVNFSEPLEANQNLNGLVQIEGAEALRYEVSGNLLRVYPSNKITGTVNVKVFEGIKSIYGYTLKNTFSEFVSFEQLKPGVRMLSKGTILPNSSATPIYFETVNLSKVEVRVIKVYQSNMLQFLQYGNLYQTYSSDLRPVGRKVAYKLLDLEKNQATTGAWTAHALDLSKLIQVDPGAMYRVEFSFNHDHIVYDCGASNLDTQTLFTTTSYNDSSEAEERYWDNEIYYWRDQNYNWEERDNPCHPAFYNQDRFAFTNLLGSDLGLIVKKGNNKTYHFATTNLLRAQPEPNTSIGLYNFQQQKIASIKTDGEGFAIYDGAKTVTFAIAENNGNFAYAKLMDGNSLSLSKFDVSGETLQKGLQGFTYLERGVHRPGDIAHLTFVLDDSANPLPKNHPVVLEVTDVNGKLVQRNVLKDEPVTVNDSLFAKKTNNFYYFPIPTQEDAPTGSWLATIKVGGAQFSKTLRIATVKPNRLKVALAFENEILRANTLNAGTLNVNWLHGAPGRNLKVAVNAVLETENNPFTNYKDYEFTDPVRDYSSSEIQFLEGTVDNQGELKLNKEIAVNGKAPGMLKATFTTLAFEGGGDYSLDVFSKKVAPYSHFVGLKSPKAKEYGSFYTDENNTFEVLSVDDSGKAIANRELEVQLFKIEWRWWWNRGYDNLSRYENATIHRPYKNMTIKTNGSGKGNFNFNIPDEDGGRFLIRVLDKKSGHATGRVAYFYKNWWQRPNNADSESSKILLFTAEKDSYKTGETATISFPSEAGNKALLSIENGSEVLLQQWISTTAKETKTSFAITPEMAPNIYVNISLLQPHGQVKNDMPIRLYGIVPLRVGNPETILKPILEMPEVLKPKSSYTVKVNESNAKPMTYTLAVVDQGLLDLTRFKTPDIHSAFYSRQALGVKTFDIFDDVMGAYSVSVDNIYAIGGGGMADDAKNRKAQRFKPVVTYLGPFYLKAGEKATHTIDMPNYVGAVRTMLIAGNNTSAYGMVEKNVPVRQPLMVLSSIPRKLTAGETLTVPVTVFAMEKGIRNVSVDISTSEALEALEGTHKSLTFDAVGDKIVNFKFKVKAHPNHQTLTVKVNGHGKKASTTTEVQIVNPNPITTKSTLYQLDGNATEAITISPFGTSGTNATSLEFSTLPPMDFSKRLAYLIQYPHGCVEQTTSAVFPQLFLNDVVDVTFEKQKETDKNIKAAIRKLSDFQSPEGGLSYWPGYGSVDDWGTTYAGHFMLEAKRKGYQLPLTFLSNWLKYQSTTARQWSRQQQRYNTDLNQAYRLYTLALAQQPELAAMNRLGESSTLSNEAKLRLAAAYALVGKESIAKNLVENANIEVKSSNNDYYTYGSVFRNRAMALETMVLLALDEQRELALSLAKNLASQEWYSTQETAFGLIALAKIAEKNGGKSIDVSYVYNGKSVTVKTEKAIANRELPIIGNSETITVKNNKGNVLYVTLNQKGKLPVGEELAQQSKLKITATYTLPNGSTTSIDNLKQGTVFTAKLTVNNLTNDGVSNVALTHIIPSGWEIVDTSFAAGTNRNQGVDYMDIRDDRSYIYFDLEAKQSKTFYIKLNASYLGNYYLPGTQVEAMYDHTYQARNKENWVTISQ